jgi:hypothetical protein
VAFTTAVAGGADPRTGAKINALGFGPGRILVGQERSIVDCVRVVGGRACVTVDCATSGTASRGAIATESFPNGRMGK